MRIIFFNILFVTFLVIAVIFVIFWGKDQTVALQQIAWPLGIALILSLSVINVIFWMNRKLLGLLEDENWLALTAYLEKKLYENRRYNSRYVRLLTQSYLATENYEGVINLKNRLAAAKPALVEDNALLLGTAYLLGGNTAAAAEFFGERLEKGKPGDWLRWYYGFSLLLTGSYERAGDALRELAAGMPAANMPAEGKRDIMVIGLAAFVLSELTGKIPAAPAEWRIYAEEGKDKVRKTLKTARKWIKKAKKLKAEIHGAAIRSYVDKAGAWIWGE
jgi:hypothetical protein